MSCIFIVLVICLISTLCHVLFFFNNPPPTEIYTLSLHDALPILVDPLARAAEPGGGGGDVDDRPARAAVERRHAPHRDRKSTRLNSSHQIISYAVFCLKKKKKKKQKKRSAVDKSINNTVVEYAAH